MKQIKMMGIWNSARILCGALCMGMLCAVFLTSCQTKPHPVSGRVETSSYASRPPADSSAPAREESEISSETKSTPAASSAPKPSSAPESCAPPSLTGEANPYLSRIHVQAVPGDRQVNRKKVAYLTFDDGPSEQTPKVLDILKKEQVKATFFVVHRGEEKLRPYYRRIVEDGHQIAIHSYTHDYKKVYRNNLSFFDEYERMQKFLHQTTGEWVSDTRFPGGTSNTVTSKENIKAIIEDLNRKGIRYYDWNVSSGDAASRKASKKQIVKNVVKGAKGLNEPVILMHDSAPKDTTVAALPEIIQGLKKAGYTFDTVEHMKTPCQHRKYPLPAGEKPPAVSQPPASSEEEKNSVNSPAESAGEASSKAPSSDSPLESSFSVTSGGSFEKSKN